MGGIKMEEWEKITSETIGEYLKKNKDTSIYEVIDWFKKVRKVLYEANLTREEIVKIFMNADGWEEWVTKNASDLFIITTEQARTNNVWNHVKDNDYKDKVVK